MTGQGMSLPTPDGVTTVTTRNLRIGSWAGNFEDLKHLESEVSGAMLRALELHSEHRTSPSTPEQALRRALPFMVVTEVALRDSKQVARGSLDDLRPMLVPPEVRYVKVGNRYWHGSGTAFSISINLGIPLKGVGTTAMTVEGTDDHWVISTFEELSRLVKRGRPWWWWINLRPFQFLAVVLIGFALSSYLVPIFGSSTIGALSAILWTCILTFAISIPLQKFFVPHFEMLKAKQSDRLTRRGALAVSILLALLAVTGYSLRDVATSRPPGDTMTSTHT